MSYVFILGLKESLCGIGMYKNLIAKLVAQLYTPRLSPLEYESLASKANDLIEKEKSREKAKMEAVEKMLDRLPFKPSHSPEAYASLHRYAEEFTKKLDRRGRAISIMAGREMTYKDDVKIAFASLKYGLKVKGIWYEKLLDDTGFGL